MLRDEVAWPEPPSDLASAAGQRLRQRVPARRRWRLRPALVLAVAAVIIAALIAGIPASRDAVADWLGIGAVKIETGARDLPPVGPGQSLSLGDRVTLSEARDRVNFTVL